jgi:FAD/FMN-containing dehydrogenase/Fe-S oxidoreductase
MTDREIPYNYTSADDGQIVRFLLGKNAWYALEKLRYRRVKGKLLRLLLRFIGDSFILFRNPFLYQELIDNSSRRHHFLRTAKEDLAAVHAHLTEDPDEQAIVAACRFFLDELETSLFNVREKRSRILRTLGAIIGGNNVCFDPFSLISHATDATDWRLYLPLAVVYPTTAAQVSPLLKAIAALKLRVIPRGGGTGLTGGSVPVGADCVMLNVEKLNRIYGIFETEIAYPDGSIQKTPVMRLEAGVITEQAISLAARKRLVFATDPTSAWASSIGGNIAENAGGKTAVLWGTAIDNLLSYRITLAQGQEWTIQRMHHPLRKILPGDTVLFEIRDSHNSLLRRVSLDASEIRTPGLGKDITNKALSGLPGIQKEGTDGIITSAEFILHPAYAHKTTCCLEFFGEDMDEASRVIVDISKGFVNRGQEALMALEHFDEEYVRAIAYQVKAPRTRLPKAVLLIDIVGHTAEQVTQGKDRLTALLKPYPNTCLFVARDAQEAGQFWQDRKRLGAIASRTNAFKLNEDIVLPLHALADFAMFVDGFNGEEDRYNQKTIVWQIGSVLETLEASTEDPQWLSDRLVPARELCRRAIDLLEFAGKDALREEKHLKHLIGELEGLFHGNPVCSRIQESRTEVRRRLIIIATHMHAGDGNVHVNIPVFSNDRDMMNRAAETADAVMARAVALGGVVSGEHGIGFTKLKYLDSQKLKDLADYRKQVDPERIMNPGKLDDLEIPEKVFASSFNLLGLEARILRHGSLEILAEKISTCIRCGRCKPDCCVFSPAENLFFHPRNKNLAIVSLIEALLYDAQRSHSTRFELLHYLEEIADHCTICHKCRPPCPVGIDTGELSILEREVLDTLGYKHTALATRLTLSYLESRSGATNRVMRKSLALGARIQRTGRRLLTAMPPSLMQAPERLSYLRSPVTPLSRGTLRDVLPASGWNHSLCIEPMEPAAFTVFYFPGCGSERLFSNISIAAIYILLKAQTRVVLPPAFLCCGYPAQVNAKSAVQGRQVLQNAIIFSQIRDMLGYLSFDACVVSCGTCREALQQMDMQQIFGCGIHDACGFVLKTGIKIDANEACLYHRPCHDSLDAQGEALLETCGYRVTPVPHCCSEAGTLSLSRPDISNAMLARKQRTLSKIISDSGYSGIKLLTHCPSCLQGLGRNADMNVTPRHIAEALAIQIGGKDWEKEARRLVQNAERLIF